MGTRGAVLHPFATVGEGWTKLEILLTFMTSSTSLKGKCRSDRFSCPAILDGSLLFCVAWRGQQPAREWTNRWVYAAIEKCATWSLKKGGGKIIAMKDFFPEMATWHFKGEWNVKCCNWLSIGDLWCSLSQRWRIHKPELSILDIFTKSEKAELG